MRTIRKIVLQVLVLYLLAAAGAGLAEVRAEETTQNGRVTEISWKDDRGEPAAGPEGYATVRYSYARNTTTERYYDEEGTPYRMQGGYYGKAVTTEGKNRVTEIVYLDENGEKTMTEMGYARVMMNYMSSGDITYIGYYGLGKKRVLVPSLGYACVVTEYSSTGMTRRTYQDENGNPIDQADGYAIIRQKLNKLHQVIRTRYEHADGTPALCADGWYLCERERDDKGRITAVKYYDTEEKLTDRGAGYAWEEYRYSDGTVTVTRYNLQGEQVPVSGDAVSILRRMAEDRITEETYLDEAGDPVNGAKGYSRIAYTYDEAGMLTGTACYDVYGNVIAP
ncbi:MAG: hypothetical protein IKQ45_01640 [Clostridia bacterium]|nr:hypothetical protein [Clostridia bacterium]